MGPRLEIFALENIPEIKPGDDLAAIIHNNALGNGQGIEDDDVIVIAQKVVSKAEGCVYKREDIEASPFARQMAEFTGHTPEYMELILRGSKRIVRMANGMVITQTHHGFVMANAGVDSSNSGGEGLMIALPPDPDKSARQIKKGIEARTHKRVAVIISDTFGRPWRNGQVNLAIGVAGINPFKDYRGRPDNDGRIMKVTQIAVADELASAAELLSGKTRKRPVVIIRGFQYEPVEATVQDLVMDHQKDLFK